MDEGVKLDEEIALEERVAEVDERAGLDGGLNVKSSVVLWNDGQNG